MKFMLQTSSKTIIKASYKNCPISDRQLFKQSSCLLPISVGQLVHEGEKLQATLSLINRTFQSCTLLVDDTIQRHTMKITNDNMTDAELYIKSYEAGTAWLDRNKNIYTQLEIPYQILRWDYWYNHPRFKQQLELVNNLYNTNVEYKNNIHDTIEEYLTRNNHNSNKHELPFAICLDYLKEECAIMTLWIEGQYQFEVYPTGRNKAMMATYKHLIAPLHHNLLKSVSLRFKKYFQEN